MVSPFGHRTDSRTIVSLMMIIIITTSIIIIMVVVMMVVMVMMMSMAMVMMVIKNYHHQPVTSIHASPLYPWLPAPVGPKHPSGGITLAIVMVILITLRKNRV